MENTRFNSLSNTQYALELITDERLDQINRHGFSNGHALANPDWYALGEMANAAVFSLTDQAQYWPQSWNDAYRDKIRNKSKLNRLVVAGALIAAEIERLYSIRHLYVNDVEPIVEGPARNWQTWKEAFIEAGVADGESQENMLQFTDWDIAQSQYFNSYRKPVDAYKCFYYENYE